MPNFLLLTTIIVVWLAVFICLAWLVPFSFLMRRIRHQHPRYYTKMSRPYRLRGADAAVWGSELSPKKRLAWFRCFKQVYKGVPRSFLQDSICQRLARGSKRAMRCSVLMLVIVLLVFVADGVTYATRRPLKPTIAARTPIASNNTPTTDTNSGTDASDTLITTENDPAPTQVPTSNSGAPTAGVTQTEPVTGGAIITVPQTQTTPAAPVAPTTLTRTNLSSAFASIALPGQNKTQKINVCKQLITQETPASDLGPSGGICTDANLSTYNTY